MLRKLLICPWFGPLPPWWGRYIDGTARLAEHGYDLLLMHDLDAFKARVRTLLDVDPPIEPGSAKIHDLRPAFGILFAAELRGYDFWGHTDFDCVYGRVEQFVSDERLAELDVYSDHTHYLCGPWALYRNNRLLADAFLEHRDWRERLEEPTVSGWVETGYTETVEATGARVLYELNHAHLHLDAMSRDGDRILDDGREVSFFHFRHSKQWPAGLA